MTTDRRPRTPRSSQRLVRALSAAVVLVISGAIGVAAGISHARPMPAETAQAPGIPDLDRLGEDLATLRVHGYTTVCNTCNIGESNRQATAGSDFVVDPNTGLVPEDPPYTDPEGPFSPLSLEAPDFDYVTWNPAWISERLGERALMDMWPGLNGMDEVSAASHIRVGGQNGSQKVWLRHWYEPTHLDKDLNADNCLTDDNNDGQPDSRVNPAPSNDDEWYPAIMTELTYLLMDNELPVSNPDEDILDDSAPRPMCGTAGRTRMIFPTGVEEDALDTDGDLVGYGLTSLDYDFDGTIDMVNVASEQTLADDLGVDLDFDGDGVLDDVDGDGMELSCDELIVMHTDAERLGPGDALQFLDHVVRIRTVADSSAVLEVWYTGDLLPRLVQTRSVGVGGAALAGDVGPLQIVNNGGGNVGVPIGPWFVHVQAVDSGDDTVTLTVGRALGAPCASMEAAPQATNKSPGGPWFLKRFYVDGHEYNVVAIMSCDTDEFQYITLRAPLPKVPTTIEQHSVRLQPYDELDSLHLPPPFNHEHTVVEDVTELEEFMDLVEPFDSILPEDRPDILHYMGGPIGPVPPVLNDGDSLTYDGRNPENPVGPYTDWLASHWFYVDEDVNPSFVGQLREKYGAVATDEEGEPVTDTLPSSFFFNEQIFTLPWNYTEFVLPDLPDPAVDPDTGEAPYDPDDYYLTSGFENPTARWRRWVMPDDEVPDTIPPYPPDLEDDFTYWDERVPQYGAPRRASAIFSPENPQKIFLNEEGTRLFGGYPVDYDRDFLDPLDRFVPCNSAESRTDIQFGAGDTGAMDVAGYPVEVPPYTDPFAPFNPQHPHAPRSDSLTFNPAYMDEFRNFGEDLRFVYQQIANMAQNARQKVYHRLWYQPEYITKIRFADDCDRDLTFPAMMQEFTYLMMDTTDNPVSVPVDSSRIAFPIATGADQLPMPDINGDLPAAGEFGHGLTTFDANFDGFDEASTIHTEQTLASHFDTQWQANRPRIPGVPLLPLPGPSLDFDGDAITDTLDADCTALNGNELVVFAVESITLDMDEDTPEGHAAMFLDHLVSLDNVTPGSEMQVRFFFTGGNGSDARPERVGGIRTLEIGDAAIVDRFQDRVTIVSPGETNPGVDGAWFVFLEDVATDAERVTITIGRALGATHSAIDDGSGNHDLTPGDPWYLKRFYVDGHEYNVTAIFTENGPNDCNENFSFISIRTPVPKGNFFNPQDTLFQQGYFLDGLPDEMSVMPPFNQPHTVALDVERIPAKEFAFLDGFDACVGELAPADALVERIREETIEPRFGTELRETFNPAFDGSAEPSDDARFRDGWETHQTIVTPWNYTDVEVPDDQQYLLTLNWTTDVGRLSFYGCTRDEPGPFRPGPDRDQFGELVPNPPPLDHTDIATAADTWAPPAGVIPRPNQPNPPQTMPDDIVPYHDGACPLGQPQRVKVFYDPADTDDVYVNRRDVDLPIDFADVAVQKRASAATVSAGDSLIYTISVLNNGPDDVENAEVVDVLPDGTTYDGDTDNCVEGPDGVLTCSTGPLAAGNERSFAVRVLVDEEAADGTTLVNRVTVTAPMAIDPDPSNNQDEAVTEVVNEADLRITKAASDVMPLAGEQLVFFINVENLGPADAEDVMVTDQIPAGMTYVSDNAGCDASALPTLTCELGDLPVGDATGFAITVEIDSGVQPGTALTNNVSVSSGTLDPNDANDSADSSVIVTAESDLRVVKTSDDDGPAAGDQLTYTIQVFNEGPSNATDVEVTDSLPEGTTYVSDTDACVQAPVGTLTCDVGSIPSGGSTQFQITVELDSDLDEGTQLTNTVVVDAPGIDDPDQSNNSDTDTVTTTRSADLQLDKAAPSTVQAGARMTYNVTVINNGPSDADDITVVDTLPSAATYVSDTDSCVEGPTGTLTCSLGDLAAGASRSFSILVDVDPSASPGSTLLNQAEVSSPTVDPDGSNDSDTASTDVVSGPQSDLSINKEAPDQAAAGAPLSYIITVDNAGPDDATDVLVTDNLPAGVDFISSSPDICTESPPASGDLTCDVGDLNAGDDFVFLINIEVDDSLSGGTQLTNTAIVSSVAQDPDSSDNSDTANTTVFVPVASADVEISKSAPTTVQAGGLLTYTLAITNNSPSTAANDVQVTDFLPGGTAYVSDDSPNGCTIGVGPSGTRVCNLGTMSPGSTVVFDLVVQVSGALPDATSLMNMAVVSASTADPNSANNQDFVFTTVENQGGGGDDQADLRITKVANTPQVVAGGPLSYTITVENLGPADVAQVLVTDTLPSELSYVSDTDSCDETAPDSGVLICDLGPLDDGASSSFILNTFVSPDVTSGTALINVAVVGPGDGGGAQALAAGAAPAGLGQAIRIIDPNPGNNASEAAVEAGRRADLAVRKDAVNTTPSAGQTVDWLVRVKNAGPSDASGVVLTDSLPDGLTYVSDTAGCGGAALLSGCNVGSLAAGATALVTVTTEVGGDVGNGTVLENAVEVLSVEPDPDLMDNVATDSVVVSGPSTADLVMQKEASDDTPEPGETITFTLTVQNAGPADAPSVQVVDTLDPDLAYVSDNAGCDVSGLPVVRCDLGMIKSGESSSVNVSVTVDAGTSDGDLIDNTATAQTQSLPDPQPGNNDDTITLRVTEAGNLVDLQVSKTASALQPIAGTSLRYTVTVENAGPANATGVVITDVLPAGVIYLDDSAGCDTTSLPTLVCSVGTIVDNGRRSVRIDVDLPADTTAGQQLENLAMASSNQEEIDESDNADDITVFVRRATDLRVDKGVTPNPAAPNQTVVYTIQVDNLGPSDAESITVVDTLPSKVTYASDTAGCDTSDLPTVTCTIDAVAAGSFASVQINAVVNPSAAGLAANTASVTGTFEDPNPENNESSAVLTIIPEDETDLSLTKTARNERPFAGDEVTFAIRVVNSGPADASNVVITDMLPQGLTLASASEACVAGDTAQEVVCEFDEIVSGDERTVTITAAIDEAIEGGTELVNTAVVTSDTVDPVQENDSDEALIVVRPRKEGGTPDNVACATVEGNSITVTWTDASKFESEFLVQASVGGGIFADIGTVASTSMETEGETYSFTASGLAFATTYSFRVQARNPDTGEASPFSATTQCTTDNGDGVATACYSGQLEQQGRSSHGGVLVKLDGVPVAVTDSEGRYDFCGVKPGERVIETRSACYFDARIVTDAVGGQDVELPFTSLPGGDTNNDGRVDLFDLVRVGASYRTAPPLDPLADCTADGRVDLFDLVLVGANYGKAGPVAFGHTGTADRPIGEATSNGGTVPALDGALERWIGEPIAVESHGSAVGDGTSPAAVPVSPVSLRTRAADNDTVAVDVVVHDVRALYAADLKMAFDPERVSVVDAMDSPGIQVKAGDAWFEDGNSFFARNRADNQAGTVQLAGSRMRPAPPMSGDVVLMTVTFDPKSTDLEDAWRLTTVDLADRNARAIPHRVEGMAIFPSGEWTRVFLPIALDGTWGER